MAASDSEELVKQESEVNPSAAAEIPANATKGIKGTSAVVPAKKSEKKTAKQHPKPPEKELEKNLEETKEKKTEKKNEKRDEKGNKESEAKKGKEFEEKDNKKPEKKVAGLPAKPRAKRRPYKPRAKKAAKEAPPKPTTEPDTDQNKTSPPEPPVSSDKAGPPPPLVPPPPPEKASSFFPVLPHESNPIDEVILQRLSECWDEEAARWTLEMRESFVDNIPRARVTRATAQFPNHSLSKAVRLSNGIPSWGQWMILRVMFGPGMCSRQKWFKEFAGAFPLAREPAYDGVVPVNAVDVLDGTAMMPLQRKRKSASVWQLEPQRSRNRAPKDHTLTAGLGVPVKRAGPVLADGISDGGVLDVKQEEEANNDEKEEMEQRWKRARTAVKGASKVSPRVAIRQLEKRYREQELQIRGLKESNGTIRRAVEGYLEMLRLVNSDGGGVEKVEKDENGGSDDEYAE